MKLLSNNWSLKLMALVLAVVLWSHVRGEVNPWEEATFKIPLEVSPPPGLAIVQAERLTRTVKVAVRAPRLTLRQLRGMPAANPLAPLEEAPLLKDGQIKARLDFALTDSGRRQIAVEATTNLDDIQILGVNPDHIAVVLAKTPLP